MAPRRPRGRGPEPGVRPLHAYCLERHAAPLPGHAVLTAARCGCRMSQGGFRESLVCTEAQAVPVPPGMTLEQAAFAEPLAVCLHAIASGGARAGPSRADHRHGPDRCAVHPGRAACRRARDRGHRPGRRAAGHSPGASAPTWPLNVRGEPGAAGPVRGGQGSWFDVVIECLRQCRRPCRGARRLHKPGAVVVQLGIGGDMTLPMNVVTAKETPAPRQFPLRRGVRLGSRRSSRSGAIDVASAADRGPAAGRGGAGVRIGRRIGRRR